MKARKPILLILTKIFVAMATSLKQSEKKKVRSIIYDQMSTIRQKFGENQSCSA